MSSNKPHQEADPAKVAKFEKIPDGWDGWLFKPKGLNIVWGNDSRYWSIPKDSDGPAELLQVCWLEVTGSTPVPLEGGAKYRITFTISMKPSAFGWNGCSVFILAKIGKKGKFRFVKITLPEPGRPSDKSEGLEITVPNDSSSDKQLHFGLYEVWTGKWKGGLLIVEAQVEKCG